ncbi:DNA polymerase Y family protein [Aliikangiella marina]|uniref:DNA polymerase Y family protein n=1 Tax=Aliikangiella marina TaxID=1712262 RepID=A0A545TJH0_9GAMM|nr:DNA polymerase Y family protein [Aliikangiella marina]TQV77311.1 DNA polymerase Y family protein [Aliikangiella marina]
MWLSIRLPLLPLETLYLSCKGSNHEANLNGQTNHDIPIGVIENNRILCANQSAYQQGIKNEQSIASAYALCDQIQLYERNKPQEWQLLNNLAMLIYGYSPNIAIDKKGLLLVEIARSLKLYQGLDNLLKNIQSDLKKESVMFQLAIGHTPTSAELLSFKPLAYSLECWVYTENLIDKKSIEEKLGELPVKLMALSDKTIDKIHSVGIRRLSQLKALPPAAIRKRFGQTVSQYLLKLYAQLAEPKDYFVPPDNFFEKLEFIDVIHHRQGLLFPIKRLIKNLCRFLTLQQKNCQVIHWELFDSEKNTIGFDVLVSDSKINEKIYIELTQLNLERYTLHAPIEMITLTANKLTQLNAANAQLFEQSYDFKQDTGFINKIRAKLGSDSCYSLQQQTEHVPELAYRQVKEIANSSYVSKSKSNEQETTMNQYALGEENHNRPSWLLEKPKPIHFNQQKLIWQGELTIISTQERITSYWWKKKIARDYYLAEHEDGIIYWVFYDQVKQQWFLHGIYG